MRLASNLAFPMLISIQYASRVCSYVPIESEALLLSESEPDWDLVSV